MSRYSTKQAAVGFMPTVALRIRGASGMLLGHGGCFVVSQIHRGRVSFAPAWPARVASYRYQACGLHVGALCA